MEMPFYSGPIYMPVCVCQPLPVPLQLMKIAMRVLALQARDWKALRQYIKEGQARISTLNSLDVINTDPEMKPGRISTDEI